MISNLLFRFNNVFIISSTHFGHFRPHQMRNKMPETHVAQGYCMIANKRKSLNTKFEIICKPILLKIFTFLFLDQQQFSYIYIYIYVCVCVCVCVYKLS